jgi:hypothetical protein
MKYKFVECSPESGIENITQSVSGFRFILGRPKSQGS